MVAFPRGLSRKPIQLVRNTIPPLPLPGAEGCDLGVQGALQGGPISVGSLRDSSGVDTRKGGWQEHYSSYHVDCPDGCVSGESYRGR